MSIPYTLSGEAIRRYMAYHNIQRLKEVAEQLTISGPYLTQLMSASRPLNEAIRLRIQSVTRLSQDHLFIPNQQYEFNFQSFNYAKYNGVMSYDERSLAEVQRYGPDMERQKLFKKKCTCI
jgi:transcriptional regulator with XRE-family HTH domain